MDIKKNFGKRIKELRTKSGLTQEKISESIGIQPENYSRIENGISFPKPENLVKLAKVLNIELAEMFQFSNLEKYEDIENSIIKKLQKDKETTILVYKFLKTLGKI